MKQGITLTSGLQAILGKLIPTVDVFIVTNGVILASSG